VSFFRIFECQSLCENKSSPKLFLIRITTIASTSGPNIIPASILDLTTSITSILDLSSPDLDTASTNTPDPNTTPTSAFDSTTTITNRLGPIIVIVSHRQTFS
jgi:hypothetical protein